MQGVVFQLKNTVQYGCHFRLKPRPVKVAFFPQYASLFPACTNQFQRNKVSFMRIKIKCFTLVSRDIIDPHYDCIITCSANHLKRVDSNSQHKFHNLNPCHFQSSHHDVSLPAPAQVPNPSNDFKTPLPLRNLFTQSLSIPPHLTDLTFNTLLSPPPIDSLPFVVELNLPRFLIPLITQETQRCYTVFTPHPHFLEQNQEQNDAIVPNPEVITTLCPWRTLLPQQAK